MAHAVTQTAGKSEMAFVGEKPWHGLGQELTLNADLDTWVRESGMEWDAKTAEVKYVRADGTVGCMHDKMVIYRSDTGAPLSVMGDGYKIVQPREVLEFYRDMIASHGFKLETAGTLFGGCKLWALARNGHDAEIVKGDRVKQYMLLATSLDGTTPTIATFTAVRVVCANTIAIALSRSQRDGVRNKAGKVQRVAVSHRSVFDAVSVKAELGYADDIWENFETQMRMLAERPMTMDGARDVLRQVFGQPLAVKSAVPAATVAPATPAAAAVSSGDDSLSSLLARPHIPKSDATAEARDDLARILSRDGGIKERRSVQRILSLYAGEGRGADHPGVKGTAWGLLNAVTEFVDHQQGHNDNTRLNSAFFGRGQDFKQSTLQALLSQ